MYKSRQPLVSIAVYSPIQSKTMLHKLLNILREPTTAKLAKGSGIVLFFKVIGALGGYVLLFSLAKTGGERAVGIYEVAFTTILIGSTVGRWGLDTVLVKELGQLSPNQRPSRTHYLSIFGRTLVMAAAVSIIAFVLASFFTRTFFNDTPDDVLRTAALAIVPFTIMLLNAEAYRGLHKPVLFSINQHGTIYLLIAILLLTMPWDFPPAESAKFALIFLLGISALMAMIGTLHLLWLSDAKSPAPQRSRTLYAMATPMLISSALFLVMSWSDTLMLSYYLPEEAVGTYRIAFKIATLITFAQFALNTVVAPMISGLHSGGQNMVPLARRVAMMNLLTAGPIFLGIIVLGPFLLGMFGLENTTEAYTFLAILSIGQLANAFAGPVLNVLNMTGHETSARNTMLIMATLNIIANALLIPALGPLGAAIATSTTMVGWNLWAGLLVYKFHGLITVPFLAHKSKPHGS